MSTTEADLYEANASCMRNLFESGAFSDFTVFCDDEIWKVHRAIICGRSEYFKKILNSDFLEARTGLITIEGHEPWVVEQLLLYLYAGNYSLPTDTDARTGHLELYAIGKKYLVESLSQLAIERLVDALVASKWLTLAKFEQIAEYVYLYESMDAALVGAVAVFARPELSYCLARRDFRDLLRRQIDFKLDVLKAENSAGPNPSPSQERRFRLGENLR